MNLSERRGLAMAVLESHQSQVETSNSPASPRHSLDSASSEHSETSTLQYEQEPWSEFRPRVEALCRMLWPREQKQRKFNFNNLLTKLFPWCSTTAAKSISVDRLHGGDSNSITAITLPPSINSQSGNYVLRVPRWGQDSLQRTFGTVEYLSQNTSIPVAAIIAKDFSNENPLGKPYLLQQRIPGVDLDTLWDDLNHNQRCAIALELGSVLRSLLASESPVTGYFSVPSATRPRLVDEIVAPFRLTNTEGDEFEDPAEYARLCSNPRARESTVDFYRCQISRWRAFDLASNGGEINHTVELWDSMSKVIDEMSELGVFTEELHCLCHSDLYPRNIMAQIQNNGSIRLTGILDWDEAVVAPKLVCCEPPSWLWGSKPEDASNGAFPIWPYEAPGANDEPRTIEQRELKRIFDKQVGPDYLSSAYGAQYRVARGLFRIVLFGLMSNDSYDAAYRLVSDWESLRNPGLQEGVDATVAIQLSIDSGFLL